MESEERDKKLYEIISPLVLDTDTVLDANCGIAPISRRLKCKRIVAFDSDVQMISEASNYIDESYFKTDREFAATNNIVFDVIMLLGLTGGHVKGIESDYECEFIEAIIKQDAPRIIVLEMSADYYNAEILSNIEKKIESQYRIKRKEFTTSAKNRYMQRRIVSICENKIIGGHVWIYKKLAEQYATGNILKTDLWNEVKYKVPIKAGVYIELDDIIVLKANKRGFNAIQGDIRKLPFRDAEFDTVMDFSTIDHIADYEVALQEYSRVLIDNGRLIMVVWIGDIKMSKTFYGEQYYFNYKSFTKCLQKYFKVMTEEKIQRFSNNEKQLMFFLCEKLIS